MHTQHISIENLEKANLPQVSTRFENPNSGQRKNHRRSMLSH
jgi:hypothetical protein